MELLDLIVRGDVRQPITETTLKKLLEIVLTRAESNVTKQILNWLIGEEMLIKNFVRKGYEPHYTITAKAVTRVGGHRARRRRSH
jgi:hypothetical protein